MFSTGLVADSVLIILVSIGLAACSHSGTESLEKHADVCSPPLQMNHDSDALKQRGIQLLKCIHVQNEKLSFENRYRRHFPWNKIDAYVKRYLSDQASLDDAKVILEGAGFDRLRRPKDTALGPECLEATKGINRGLVFFDTYASIIICLNEPEKPGSGIAKVSGTIIYRGAFF